ncbi:hypothetical protein C7999DRAFT_13208 [Corynascus novoguineensis]|uniref:Altered inheritance of mitochondria protein 11 n=1 Tax=Corynascus novoguineensis TaxID=1126955 RepID=A0AAN7HGF5_9PEZI|nr:hypothetical protein C7999DRAFT_13208 [Corynascus novoguineensis]
MGVLSFLIGSLAGVNTGVNNNISNVNNDKSQTTASISNPAAVAPPSPPSSPPPTTTASSTQPVTPLQDDRPQPTDYYSLYFSARSLRQLSLFLGGAGFFYLSVLVSRRAAARHRLAARLRFYEPNNQATGWGFLKDPELLRGIGPRDKNPAVALEALNLATLNTMAFAVMAAGGVSWALDISNVEDLRAYARRSVVRHRGERDEAAEREVAEWLVKTFGLEERKKESAGKEKEKEGEDGGVGADKKRS